MYQTLATTSFCLSLVLCGCSKRPEGFERVHGEFHWEDGSAVEGFQGVVRFDPIDLELFETQSSSGHLTPDGHFELMTYNDGDGVPVGEYMVKLFLPPGSDGKPVIHPDYGHYERSPLRASVRAGVKNYFKLTVDRNFSGTPKK